MLKLTVGVVDTIIGEGCVIIQPSNVYGAILDRCVKIGPFVEIQKGVTIGEATKVQSHSFICEGVSIGSHCFIGHGVVFINDLFLDGAPAGGDKNKWKTTRVFDNVNIGSNATILPVTICENVTIGAGSVVTKDISVPGFYAGNPAKFLRGTSERTVK